MWLSDVQSMSLVLKSTILFFGKKNYNANTNTNHFPFLFFFSFLCDRIWCWIHCCRYVSWCFWSDLGKSQLPPISFFFFPSAGSTETNCPTLGIFFFCLGIITFFDSALLAFGNVLFLIGIGLIIGLRRTFYFFARPNKIRGSICFLVGILLILIKYSFVGFAIECIGILSLFGDFFGVIVSFLRSVPVIGPLLSNPHIAPVSTALFCFAHVFFYYCEPLTDFVLLLRPLIASRVVKCSLFNPTHFVSHNPTARETSPFIATNINEQAFTTSFSGIEQAYFLFTVFYLSNFLGLSSPTKRFCILFSSQRQWDSQRASQ